MSDNARVKRPQPERTGPIRNWSGLFGSAAGGGTNDGGGDAHSGDVVSESVQLGYRVIDDYIRQAQKVADRVSRRTYDPGEMRGDVQDLAARMMEYASDFFRIWTELAGIAVSGVRASARPEAGEMRSDGEAAAAKSSAPTQPHRQECEERRSRISVAVESARPVEVCVDLKTVLATDALVVYPLRATDPKKPELRELSVSHGGPEEPICVHARIADDHPAGAYHGLVVEEKSGKPLGSITIRVSEPSGGGKQT